MNNPWENISVPQSDISARRVDADHPFNLFWGKNSFGNPLFICELSGHNLKTGDLPELEGVKANLIDSNGPKLVLELLRAEDWELFHGLCIDLLSATARLSNEDSVPTVIIRRLKRWQEFLQRQGRRGLSQSEILGLIGELLFLRDELAPTVGLRDAVLAWQGPEDYPQDFNIGTCAVELKCCSGSGGKTIRISSAEQLCPELPSLFLHVYTVGKGGKPEESLSLLELVTCIRASLRNEDFIVAERFEDLLHAVGYVDLPEYELPRYTVVGGTTYGVKSSFPRIHASELPPEVSKVSYTLSLASLDEYVVRPDWREFRSNDTG